MSVHLLKPALRVSDVYEFVQRQRQWLTHDGQGRSVYPVWTSRKPSRMDEMLDGGSVYWIIKNQIMCRQSILAIEDVREGVNEKPSYLILCDPELVRVQPIAKRAFQGWRYLEVDTAPKDCGAIHANETSPPPQMEKILREAGLI